MMVWPSAPGNSGEAMIQPAADRAAASKYFGALANASWCGPASSSVAAPVSCRLASPRKGRCRCSASSPALHVFVSLESEEFIELRSRHHFFVELRGESELAAVKAFGAEHRPELVKFLTHGFGNHFLRDGSAIGKLR